MADQERKRSRRSRAAVRFDEFTFATFAVLLMITTVAVFMVGGPTAMNRLGCGLNDIVNAVMAYPRGCR